MFILQWNLNGYHNNTEMLKMLINEYEPKVIALQETHFKYKSSSPSTYQNFSKIRPNQNRSSGGVSIFVKNNIEACLLPINTNLEAIAITINHHGKMNICNIYIPHPDNIDSNDVEQLIRQIPTPRIILGDLNSHNPVWGSDHLTTQGRNFGEIFDNQNLTLMNDGSKTHFNAYNASFSCIDLSLCDPVSAPLLTWKALKELYSSDHFPIIIDHFHAPLQPATALLENQACRLAKISTNDRR